MSSSQELSLKLFVVLSKVHKGMMDQAVQDMKRHGLSSTEFMILELLYHKGPSPLQQIGDKVLITSGSITYNIDKLEKKGLLRRTPSAADRRVIYAEMTEAGKQWMDKVFPLHAKALDDAMGGLSPEEKLQTIDLLKKLGHHTSVD